MKLTNLGTASDFNVAGDPKTGNIVLHFKNDSKQEAVGLAMPPAMVAVLLQHMAICGGVSVSFVTAFSCLSALAILKA